MKFSKEQKKLHRNNLRLMKKYMPTLAELLQQELPTNILVDRLDDGDLDILINGARFYGTDAVSYAKHQIDAFVRIPSMVEIGAPVATEDRTPLHARAFEKQLAAFNRHKIGFRQDIQRIDAATLFVFGVGLGYHLYPLIIETQARSLVVFETELVFIALSMYFIEWRKIFDVVKNNVCIIKEMNPETAFTAARHYIHNRNAGIQHYIYNFQHYHSEHLDAVVKYFRKNVNFFFDGLGFYDDEKFMTRNHLLNSYMDEWMICAPSKTRFKESAVVVGAGPSLNNDIEWLRHNQDKLIIFSGGSAMPVLLKNGIVPDFHVEIENIPLNYDLLAPLFEKYDLSGVVLIPSSTMDVRSARLFKRRLWYLREGVMASHVYEIGMSTLNWQNPTVVNTATSAALACGFRNILLLGADFGTRDPRVHHSKDSFYDYHQDLKKMEFKFPDQAKANFGGTAHTNTHYLGGIHYMKSLAETYRDAKIFNGSDGVHVPRLTPIKSRRYNYIPLHIHKPVLVDAIYRSAPSYSWENRYGETMFDDLRDNFSCYIDQLRIVWRKEMRRNRDFIYMLSALYQSMAGIDPEMVMYNPMLNGTVNTLTLMMMVWWRKVIPEDRAKFEKVCRRQWLLFLDMIEKDFDAFLNDLRQELPLVRPELFNDKSTLLLDAELGVQNAE